MPAYTRITRSSVNRATYDHASSRFTCHNEQMLGTNRVVVKLASCSSYARTCLNILHFQCLYYSTVRRSKVFPVLSINHRSIIICVAVNVKLFDQIIGRCMFRAYSS